MKTKKILKLIMLFAVACIFSFCNNKDPLDDGNIDWSKIDLSNIADLHAQPLPVIQKCVEGKWKWLYIFQSGVIGVIPLSHTFVEIKNDSIVITQEGDDNFTIPQGTFSYTWKKKKISPWSPSANETPFYTNVMQFNNGQAGWYFVSIQNDTLGIGVDIPYDDHIYEGYLFSKIK